MKKHQGQKLTMALKNGQLVKITEVENGLACGCICTLCKSQLIAKNNPTNDKILHFAHHNAKECEGAYESVLHLLAKEVLLKTKTIRTPNYLYNYDRKNNIIIYVGKKITFEQILIEQTVVHNNELIKPDAIGIIKGKEVYIEFAKTHFVDNYKKEKIKKIGKPCIEMDIRKLDIDELQIEEFFLSDNTFSYWIQNLKLDAKLKADLLKLELEKKRLRDERIAEENRIAEKFELLFKQYESQNEHQMLVEEDGEVNTCPLKLKAINEFKKSHFYKHPILKRIIDGEKWNGKRYGQTVSYIYVNGEEITIYPLEDKYLQSDNQIKESKLVYAGLFKIRDDLKSPSYITCNKCEFSVNHIPMGERRYRVCKHPKQ